MRHGLRLFCQALHSMTASSVNNDDNRQISCFQPSRNGRSGRFHSIKSCYRKSKKRSLICPLLSLVYCSSDFEEDVRTAMIYCWVVILLPALLALLNLVLEFELNFEVLFINTVLVNIAFTCFGSWNKRKKCSSAIILCSLSMFHRRPLKLKLIT